MRKIQLPLECSGTKIFSTLESVAQNKGYDILYMGRERVIQGGKTETDWASVFLSRERGPRFEFFEVSERLKLDNPPICADKKYSSICVDYRFRDGILRRHERTEEELKGLIEEFYRCIVI